MVSRQTLEFAVGVVAAGVVAGVLSVSLPTPYALAVGMAAGTPSLVRTSLRLDRDAYDAAKTSGEQVVDGAVAAGAALAVGLGGGYLAVSNGYGGSIGAAVVAALAVFGGQVSFYALNGDYIE